MRTWKQQFKTKRRYINMRTLEQVTGEHNQVMFQIGIERYRIECSNRAIEKLLLDGLALNEEGAKLMKEKQENEAKSNNGNGTESKHEEQNAQGASVETAPAEAHQLEAAL